MNSKTKMLCAFTVFLFLGSLAIGSASASFVLSGAVNTEQLIPTETYGDDRRNEAVNILIYTEFTDLDVDGEWDRTMSSMIGSLGGRFTYDNLTDYTQLASMIDEYDILLLSEMETANYSVADTVVAAWISILPQFVSDGGIVICNTFGPPSGQRGIAARILNGTGLMELYNPEPAYPTQMNLVEPNDALALNVPATYTSASGTISFDTTDGVVVVEDNSDSKAVVVHKTMEKGHVVLLGFDMYTVNANQDTLLQNSILLHRHVIFDSSHGAADNILGGFEDFALDLQTNGFAVSNMPTFHIENLTACDILVVSRGSIAYTANEIDSIENFVLGGGGLFIIGEWSSLMNTLDPIIERLGYSRNKTSDIQDTDDMADGNADWPIYDGNNLKPHAITVGVTHVEQYAGSGFIETPTNSFNFVVTDDDGTAQYSQGPTPILEELAIGVASHHEMGRVVVWGDSGTFLDDADVDSDGTNNYLDGDNEVMGKNIIRWLSAAGIPEQTVVFDYSNSPLGNLYGTWNSLANLLMINGYNTIWTDEFDPAIYNTADIVVINDGAFDYNASEITYLTNYVQDGGGLLLWGDHSSYCEQIDPIAQEFGLFVNTTGSVYDVDHTPIGYVVYEGSNIGTHPIMEGVERVEADLSNAFISIGSGTALVSTDGDGTSFWNDGSPADNLAVYAATTFNKGRVVYISDYNLGGLLDADSDGFGNLYDSDNPVFVANVFKWLAENRAPTVEVLTPNGGEVLNGTITVEWDAVDFDNDPMTFDVYYSDNNGSDWTLLVDSLVLSEYEWNTTLHDDGTDYMIRVEVTAGGITAEDISDNPFELDNFAGGGIFGIPIDTTTLIIIIAGVIVVIIIIVIVMKKKK